MSEVFAQKQNGKLALSFVVGVCAYAEPVIISVLMRLKISRKVEEMVMWQDTLIQKLSIVLNHMLMVASFRGYSFAVIFTRANVQFFPKCPCKPHATVEIEHRRLFWVTKFICIISCNGALLIL